VTTGRRPAGVIAAAIAATVVAIGGCGAAKSAGSTGQSARQLATADARSFLNSYVAPSGRVVRRDQGGDTVSEGQGYALLLAAATGDRRTFASVWGWTRNNLQRPDGLFAYHWANGQVTASMPAADADVQIAWALAIAGAKWGDAGYTAAARRVATAVAGSEVGYDDQGRPTVAAGPWAVPSGQPTVVEPGYWTYPADQALATLTGDHRWMDVAAADQAHLSSLTAQGHQLPADWAELGNGVNSPRSTSTPGGSGPPQSGQDGLRALVWASCSATARALEPGWWSLVSATANAAPLTRALSGRPAASSQAPLSDVAAAAAANGAGHAAETNRLLHDADTVAHRYPTYYGSAWVALGRVILTTDLLPGCHSPSA